MCIFVRHSISRYCLLDLAHRLVLVGIPRSGVWCKRVAFLNHIQLDSNHRILDRHPRLVCQCKHLPLYIHWNPFLQGTWFGCFQYSVFHTIGDTLNRHCPQFDLWMLYFRMHVKYCFQFFQNSLRNQTLPYIHILREHICHLSCNQAKFPWAGLFCHSSFRYHCRVLPRDIFVHKPTGTKTKKYFKCIFLMGHQIDH